MRARIVTHVAIAGFLVAGPLHAQSIADAYERIRDAVVLISTVETSALPEDDPSEGLGSGVLIDPAGVVLTAAHVVQVASEIEVQFADGEVIAARVATSDAQADVAVLRLARPPARPVAAPLGDSSRVRVGDEVFIVGAPLGIGHTLTVGHISGRRTSRALGGQGFSDTELFQTDAAINVGNSGGPMFNRDGEVVGVVSYMLSSTGGNEGLGFAVTSNAARELVLERRSLWSGLEGFLLTGRTARALNLPQDAGVLVQRVVRGSPADRLGLRPGTIPAVLDDEPLVLGGDVILEVAGIRVAVGDGRGAIRERLANLQAGEPLKVVVLRDGQRVELQAVAVPR